MAGWLLRVTCFAPGLIKGFGMLSCFLASAKQATPLLGRAPQIGVTRFAQSSSHLFEEAPKKMSSLICTRQEAGKRTKSFCRS